MSYVKKRVQRKPGRAPQDIIADQKTLASWISDNVNTIIYAAGAILLVLVITLGLTWMKGKKREAANSALSSAMAVYQTTVAKLDEEPDVANEKLEQALESLNQVASEYAGAPQGQTAMLFKANVLFRLGRYQEAVGTIEEVDVKNRELVGGINAYYLLARSYEAMEDFDKAVEIYQKARKRALGNMSAVIDIDLARCHELSGDREAALAIYQKILSEYPDTVFATRAEKKLATLGFIDQETL